MALMPGYRAPIKPGQRTNAGKPDSHGAEAERLSLATLHLYPLERVMHPVMNSLRTDLESGTRSRAKEIQSAHPLPINERPLDNEYAWKGNPQYPDGWLVEAHGDHVSKLLRRSLGRVVLRYLEEYVHDFGRWDDLARCLAQHRLQCGTLVPPRIGPLSSTRKPTRESSSPARWGTQLASARTPGRYPVLSLTSFYRVAAGRARAFGCASTPAVSCS